mgnify:CR=1 FL=1|jgi:hypothetical protein
MAQYVFVRLRVPTQSNDILGQLSQVCDLLTPDVIRGESKNIFDKWPDSDDAYYGIQNSEGVGRPAVGVMLIGFIHPKGDENSSEINSEADGSYAVIKADDQRTSFFTDQFGSRTLWYYFDEHMLVVSTSQRAIVKLKGCFTPNDEAMAWFMSSGSQGPFLSWDTEIRQVRPEFEYEMDGAAWSLGTRLKPGMNLPSPGTVLWADFLPFFEKTVTETLEKMVNEFPEGTTLLPLSGGLDSRLLLGLCKYKYLHNKVGLVNWGVPTSSSIFDDKAAAHRVAKSYQKELIDMTLPAAVKDLDRVLDRFVEASEGRIDHFNGYTDGFANWANLHRQGYRSVLRGDIPFTEGLDLNDVQTRAHIGLDHFEDYCDSADYKLNKYIKIQSEYDMQRRPGESLLHWRDRVYVTWRVPMVIASFTDLISGFTENRAPMMNWTLYKMYMGLPDRAKGDKKHIQELWKKHDLTGVPSHAVGSLCTPVSLFESGCGWDYLIKKLSAGAVSKHLSPELVRDVVSKLNNSGCRDQHVSPGALFSSARPWLSDRMPSLLKAYIKSRRLKRISPIALGYRIVLAGKVLDMYKNTAVPSPEVNR